MGCAIPEGQRHESSPWLLIESDNDSYSVQYRVSIRFGVLPAMILAVFSGLALERRHEYLWGTGGHPGEGIRDCGASGNWVIWQAMEKELCSAL